MKKQKTNIEIVKDEIEEIKREIHVESGVRMATNPKRIYND